MKSSDDYINYVNMQEEAFTDCAKKSFEAFSPTLIDGTEAIAHYLKLWKSQIAPIKLFNRTPIQLERDRILYSSLLRKQTEKYHVLYSGQKRITRNYTTHTMRMAHISRSVAKTLGLNYDFAEAIALGCKAGAVPFIHASKDAIDSWIKEKLYEINQKELEVINRAHSSQQNQQRIPIQLEYSDIIRSKIKLYMPWLSSNKTKAYSSGQESYWLLCTDPFLRLLHNKNYFPETIYGIWRHSRKHRPTPESFYFEWEAPDGKHSFDWKNGTYEGMIVQYADDITWAIENLNDANNVAMLNNNTKELYADLNIELSASGQSPIEVTNALLMNDSGSLYGYFVSDLCNNSHKTFNKIGKDGTHNRIALREGNKEGFIGLSETGEMVLEQMIHFLDKKVFEEPRVKNRKKMLSTIVKITLELLYSSKDAIEKYINDRAKQEAWTEDNTNSAIKKIDDNVHRVQLAVDIFSSMSDQEIFDFVGMHSL